jgi:stage II sporulation protein D
LCKELRKSVDRCATLILFPAEASGQEAHAARWAGDLAMISTFTAAVLAALGLATGSPAVHAAQPAPTIFVKGHGWGHGVGMPQYGAYGYALHGWTHGQIIAHYYPGTKLGLTQLKTVRVLLVPSAKRVVVSSTSPFFVRDRAGKRYKLAAGGQTLGPGLKLKVAAAKELKALQGPLVFSAGADPLVLGSRAYRGSFRVSVNGSALRVVNTVSLAPYLWSVVPSEMPDRWPAQALQAQAVVARTYALAHLRNADFDVYPDTRSQVYGGIAAESPTATDAVNATASEVVTYKGNLADTFFYSSSGGKTANVQDVWKSAPVPYLVSVPDPYDTLSPYHDWGPLRFTPTMLGRRLHSLGKLVDLRSDVGASGRVRALTVVGEDGERTLTGAAVRRALGLRSTWFQIGLLTLTPPAAPVVYGSKAMLVGLARGLPKVTLESRSYGGQWKPLAPLVPKNGQIAASLTPKVSTDYRLSADQIQSGAVRLAVAPRIRIFVSPDRLSLTGRARPVLSGSAVQIQKLAQNGWTTVARTKTTANGDFSASVEFTPGVYRVRVVAGRGFAPGVSRMMKVTA